jgi:uncharacterized protein (UPF0297 family)
METTKIFDTQELNLVNQKETLKKIYEDLEEHGYDASKQLVGYLISGDPGYISSYKECRSRVLELDRNSILEFMLKEYIK